MTHNLIEEAFSSENQQSNYIHISVVKIRRKKISIIMGLDDELYDFPKILSYLKKAFSCNGTISKDKQTGKPIIQLSGSHNDRIKEFIYQEGIGEYENIKLHGS